MLLAFITKGQDLHLSQFNTSNLLLNPAYTGAYDGDFRATLNHRNQWRQLPSALVTSLLSLEKRFSFGYHNVSFGALIADDNVSELALRSNRVILSAAYEKFFGDHLITGGIQTGITLRRTDFGIQTFPDQWNRAIGIFDQNINSGESGLSETNAFLNLNLGFSYTKHLTNKLKFTAGYAAFNLNRPRNGFAEDNSLAIRQAFSTRFLYEVSKRFTLAPNVLWMYTTQTSNLITGLIGKYKLSSDVSVGLGLSHRGAGLRSESIFPTALLEVKRFQFGLSNDFNSSSLSSNSANKSTYEISIIYTSPSNVPNKVSIPCERF